MKVGDIKWEAGFIKRIIIFQSISQFFSFLFFLSLGIGVVWLVLFVFNFHLKLTLPVLIPSLILSMYPVYASIPQSFIIEGVDVGRVECVVKCDLERFGYIKDIVNSGILYVSKLPAVLSWRENSIVILGVDGGVKIIAPRIISKRIHALLASA